jgi:hypothetical protein
MRIDEETPGSVANQEAVKVLNWWLVALYLLDSLVCVMGASIKNLSLGLAGWFFLESLFFSYFLGLVLLFVIFRYLGRALRIPELKQVGMLRVCLVLACLSVIMGGLLVYRQPAGPPLPWVHH